jgi:hypothetical protein
MKPSQEYLILKAGNLPQNPFSAILTRSLAEELLSRQCSTCSIDYLLNNFSPVDGIPIRIVYETDELWDGANRIAAFLESGLNEVECLFLFTGGIDKIIEVGQRISNMLLGDIRPTLLHSRLLRIYRYHTRRPNCRTQTGSADNSALRAASGKKSARYTKYPRK